MGRALPCSALVVCAWVFCFCLLGDTLHGQAQLAFDAASIKRSMGSPNSASSSIQGGRYLSMNQPIDRLLTFAFPTTRGDVVGAPAWVSQERYDVIASAGREATREEIQIMMRTLLEKRLSLRARIEQREQPVYALVVARADGQLGPQLRKAEIECDVNGAATLRDLSRPGRRTESSRRSIIGFSQLHLGIGWASRF